MPRRPREELADAIHHVYARGNDRRAIYLDDGDRAAYLAMLGRVVVMKGWRCLAYCLMDNHVHLLIETPEPNLGSGMQRLHGLYAQSHNERHGRSGHLFQCDGRAPDLDPRPGAGGRADRAPLAPVSEAE